MRELTYSQGKDARYHIFLKILFFNGMNMMLKAHAVVSYGCLLNFIFAIAHLLPFILSSHIFQEELVPILCFDLS